MPISIGINKNIIISAAGFDDKKRLFIELKQLNEENKESSPFDELLTAGVTNDGGRNTLTYNFLKFLVPNKADQTKEQKVGLITDDIKRFKNVLTQILEQYMLSENIDLHKVWFEEAGLDGQNYATRILDQDVLDKVYSSLTKRFVELITPFLGNPEFALRFKLVRQSKDKSYAKIPDRFIADRPFVDLMTVPDDVTRVKFDDWEIKNGLNDPTPISSSTAEPKNGGSNGHAVLESNPFAPQNA